jgi:hypothetical protein
MPETPRERAVFALVLVIAAGAVLLELAVALT